MEKVGEGKIQDPEFFKFVLYTEMAMEMGMVTEEEEKLDWQPCQICIQILFLKIALLQTECLCPPKFIC